MVDFFGDLIHFSRPFEGMMQAACGLDFLEERKTVTA